MTKREFVINDVNWAQELEHGLEEYMMDCWTSLDEGSDFETVSGEPFCGCGTCESREQLFFVTPKIIKAFQEGKVELC
jgi:hypothetical protein